MCLLPGFGKRSAYLTGIQANAEGPFSLSGACQVQAIATDLLTCPLKPKNEPVSADLGFLWKHLWAGWLTNPGA